MTATWYAPVLKTLALVEELAAHIVAGTIVIAGGLGLNWFLEKSGDPRMFDAVPWRYVVDAGDLVMLVAVTIFSIRAIADIGRGEG